MNKIIIVALSTALAGMVHAQAAPHAKTLPRVDKAPEHATVGQPIVPAPSTNTTRTNTMTPQRNGAKPCYQGSSPQDNPTGTPCRHVKTTQM
jgi:hypothetical protein